MMCVLTFKAGNKLFSDIRHGVIVPSGRSFKPSPVFFQNAVVVSGQKWTNKQFCLVLISNVY